MPTATKTTTSKSESKSNPIDGILDTIQNGQKTALDSTRRFVESIDGAIPSVLDTSPRSTVIDAAFTMTEKVMDASNDLARKVVAAAIPA